MSDPRTKDFTDAMRSLTQGGRTRAWRVFGDFCELGYCAVAKPAQHPDRREALEDRYMKAAQAYTREQLEAMSRMLGMVTLAMDERRDFLGHVYEAEGFCDQKYGAQFFTPEHLAEAMARMTVDANEDREVTTIAEPASGSGRMVLAACRVLAEGGLDVPTRVWVEATDLDGTCARMTYLQMALAGIPGVVRHANTLTGEQFDAAVTPTGARLYATSAYLRDWLAADPNGAEKAHTGSQEPQERRAPLPAADTTPTPGTPLTAPQEPQERRARPQAPEPRRDRPAPAQERRERPAATHSPLGFESGQGRLF